MALGQETSRNQPVVTGALQALDQFKYEVASELGINPEYQSGYWGNISSRECGAVGGHMVRRMIAAAEQSLMNQAASGQKPRFGLEPDAQGSKISSAHNPAEM
ncbi:MAG: alpha/beta-type small acid-soluble spore protein [Limnochordia bacterium]|nr:alpha/beta-type small acid-soluble spore protein [Limnochordia bacterium]MDD2629648.1 alpha/beta-type small acid-soluble spore protein [Limnochordia bacterium]MDD4517038.1 alpha/beta-type small acid-soluble spore protein [Limnochordia bacterium]